MPKYVKQAGEQKAVDFVLHIIPDTRGRRVARGEILQVLLFAILFGFSLMALGERGDRCATSSTMRRMRVRRDRHRHEGRADRRLWRDGLHDRQVRPGAIRNLIGLIVTFYATAALFVIVVLGIDRAHRRLQDFQIPGLHQGRTADRARHHSSSESALPSLMEKLERLGCSKSVVGLVVPTGYSFNLDGTNIYMTLATLFIAQALGVDLTLGQQMTILVVAMLTSKGACGVTGAGFITLAATLAVVNPAPGAGHGDRVSAWTSS